MTSTSEAPTTTFTREQIKTFYRDGFVILRNVVSEAHVNEVRRGIFEELGNLRSQAVHAALRPEDFQTRAEYEAVNEAALATLRGGSQPSVLGLFNDTVLISIIEAALGAPVVPVKGAQLATSFPAGPGDTINESGYRDRDTPFHGWVGHLDGLWNGGSRIHQRTDRPMNESERKRWSREAGTNSVPKYNPEHRANIRNFTVLIGVALSDQRTEGVGNLGLLKGAHHAIEEFFRWQRDAGGPLGPDGPGWPRIDTSAPNFGGLRHYPDAVRDRFAQDAARSGDCRLGSPPSK